MIEKLKQKNKAQELSRARYLFPRRAEEPSIARLRFKKAQEEFVGFALIIIIVAVILLVFLSFSIKQPRENLQSYEVESFLQTALQYTTDCKNNYEFLPVQKLIVACIQEETCIDGRKTCDALNETLIGIVGEGWGVGKEYPTKAYELGINTEEQKLLNLRDGNITRNYKSASQNFSKSGNSIQIYFRAYS